MILPSNIGAFVPTTNIWDISQVYNVDVNSPQFKELIVRLYQNISNISTALNIKDSGYYTLNEFVNGQLLFPNPLLSSSTTPTAAFRQIFRIAVNFGALPNTAAKSVAHGLTPQAQAGSYPTNPYPGWTFTRIYATASDTVGLNYLPIPSAQANLTVNATNVTITTTANLSSYTFCYVFLEYVKF